jgi:hypothetical protein
MSDRTLTAGPITLTIDRYDNGALNISYPDGVDPSGLDILPSHAQAVRAFVNRWADEVKPPDPYRTEFKISDEIPRHIVEAAFASGLVKGGPLAESRLDALIAAGIAPLLRMLQQTRATGPGLTFQSPQVRITITMESVET